MVQTIRRLSDRVRAQIQRSAHLTHDAKICHFPARNETSQGSRETGEQEVKWKQSILRFSQVVHSSEQLLHVIALNLDELVHNPLLGWTKANNQLNYS